MHNNDECETSQSRVSNNEKHTHLQMTFRAWLAAQVFGAVSVSTPII